VEKLWRAQQQTADILIGKRLYIKDPIVSISP